MYTNNPASTRRRGRAATLNRFLSFAAFAAVATFALQGCNGGGNDTPTTSSADKYPNVPTPAIAAMPSDPTGSSNHNYPFFASDIPLGPLGYTEAEFMMSGKANSYDMAAPTGIGSTPVPTANANVVTSGNPYTTRIYVVRPTDVTKFNGTVVVEWQNATSKYDIPVHFFQQRNWLLSKGYAYVAVTAQSAPITDPTFGLKKFSPGRYAALDLTNGGTIGADGLSYDVFSQAAKAIRSVPAVIGAGANIKKVIAVGASQSAGRLGIYLNSVQPESNIFDGALMSVGGPKMRTDLSIPIMKVLSETEIDSYVNEVPTLQPDTAKFATWEVAGSSHTEIWGLAARATMLLRDQGLLAQDVCSAAQPSRTRVPIRFMFNSAIDKIEKAIDGAPLITAPPLQLITAGLNGVKRDNLGNAIGGIRVGESGAPTGVSNGTNTDQVCFLNGVFTPFTTSQLDALYSSHADYASKFAATVNASVAAGYILPEDATLSLAEANGSVWGSGLNCDANPSAANAPTALCADILQFSNTTSSVMLHRLTSTYPVSSRTAMLAAIDAATTQIGTARLYSDPNAARPFYRSASSSLSQYEALVATELTNKTLSAEAAAYLTSYSANLRAAMQAL